MKKKILLLFSIIFLYLTSFSQNVGSSPEYIKAITAQWKGERFADGRPKVSDELLERLEKLPIEAVWAVLRNRGYLNQFEGNWTILHP
ncbi:MAG: RraA family protein, partial [Bacteroidetes bacterium]|nr:RraA family protein [Bacteroidota bacterium]